MGRTRSAIRRALGAPLLALTLLVGAAGPLMDSADLLAETRLVSSEASASTQVRHDHRLCIQVGANPGLASHEVLTPAVRPTRAGGPGASVPSWLPCGEPEAPAARAPPQR